VIRRIKVCLNGGRTGAGVPVTAGQLAESAVASVAAGAEAVHMHPRGPDGRESLDASDIGAAVTAVRRAGVPIGVSTGLWITGSASERLRLVRGWAGLADRPDFASVNVHEDGYQELVATLTGLGIGVEAGVWSPADADRAGHVERVLVEIIGGTAAGAVPAADAILARLGGDVPILLHGEQDACWPLVAHAGRLGLPTRIGLEDTLLNADGSPATSNADLVRQALRIWAGEDR
jgi:uncharacterized protein (DUF849 family)